jgi:arylsulfatase A-like enzyme
MKLPALLWLASALVVFSAGRPNILWLIGEDFGQHLGCYGAKVSTPNLDRLAREGVLYRRFFTTAPVCSPSRSAFMTGMYQTTIGAHNHRSHRDDGFTLPSGVRVLTDWMRDAGYFTANVREFPEPIRFKGVGKTDWNFTYTNASCGNKPFDSEKWNDLKSHQPFYAQINFQETHRKFNAPKHTDPATVELPPYYPEHPVTRQDWAEYLDSAIELDRKCGVVLRQLEKDGLASNTVVIFFGDNGQAHVRGKQFCYEEGLLVPLIVRWPQAFPPPKNYRSGSENSQLLEAIDLAPTMLEVAGAWRNEFHDSPAFSRKGVGDSGRSSLQPRMQGVPFLGEHAGAPKEYVFGARDRCDETVFRLRTVRDERYRYIRNFTPERPFLQPNEYKEKQYPVWNLLKELHAAHQLSPAQEKLCQPNMPAEELYDLESDPWEINNLAGSPQHAATLARLRRVLEEWIEATHDQGRQLEPADLVARKGLTKTNGNANIGYTLDGSPPGGGARKPPRKTP